MFLVSISCVSSRIRGHVAYMTSNTGGCIDANIDNIDTMIDIGVGSLQALGIDT